MQPTEPKNPTPSIYPGPKPSAVKPGSIVSPTVPPKPQPKPANPSEPPETQLAGSSLGFIKPATPPPTIQLHTFPTIGPPHPQSEPPPATKTEPTHVQPEPPSAAQPEPPATNPPPPTQPEIPPAPPEPPPASTPPANPTPPQEPVNPSPSTEFLAATPIVTAAPQVKSICLNPFKNIANGLPKFIRTNLITSLIMGVVMIGGGSLLATLVVLVTLNGDSVYTVNSVIGIVVAATVWGIVLLAVYLIQSKLVIDGVRDKRTGVYELLLCLKRLWLPIIWGLMLAAVYLLSIAIVFLPHFTHSPALGILSVLLGIGFAVLALKYMSQWFFALFAAVDDSSLGPVAALHKSSQLTDGYKLNIFLTCLSSSILIIIILAGLEPGVFKPGTAHEVSGVIQFIADVLIFGISLLSYLAIAELYRQIQDSQKPVHARRPAQQQAFPAAAPPTSSQPTSFNPTPPPPA